MLHISASELYKFLLLSFLISAVMFTFLIYSIYIKSAQLQNDFRIYRYKVKKIVQNILADH